MSAGPVARYCALYKASGLEPLAFAHRARTQWPELCHDVLNIVGCWPASEPELAALQRVGP